MAEKNHHHHHHHHHHHESMDSATMFKIKSLNSIENRKKYAKWLFRALCIVAAILFIIVLVVYNIN